MKSEAQNSPASLPTLWVFEDQLSLDLPSFTDALKDAPVLLIESRVNMRRVPYHQRRLTFLVAAMRHFAREIAATGRPVVHYPLRARGYKDSLSAIQHHMKATGSTDFWIVEPSEFHTREWLDTLPAMLGITIRYFPNTLFLTDREQFARWARRVKSPVMEIFYRQMRKQHAVLMEGDQPAGGEWNFDKSNRKPYRGQTPVPAQPTVEPDAITRAAMADVAREFANHPGRTEEFDLPVTRADAERYLADFVRDRLPTFGDYEDAMSTTQPILFHSMISPLLNAGLLRPLQIIRAAEEAYVDGHAPIHCVEGFIRQILGWREYVYGIYWTFMPKYRERNARNNTRPLPQFFWDAKTDMNCLRHCMAGVLDRAWTHHIQRLMVICNFATLAGLNPQKVNDWFLAMYVDSHDWVVTPNVVGMAMNADGGTIATKPYVASAAYINRMSDYCKGCKYDHSARTGDNACPFNYLYWTFLQHYRDAYGDNPRMGYVLKNLDRIEPAEIKQMMLLRKKFIEAIEYETPGEYARRSKPFAKPVKAPPSS